MIPGIILVCVEAFVYGSMLPLMTMRCATNVSRYRTSITAMTLPPTPDLWSNIEKFNLSRVIARESLNVVFLDQNVDSVLVRSKPTVLKSYMTVYNLSQLF